MSRFTIYLPLRLNDGTDVDPMVVDMIILYVERKYEGCTYDRSYLVPSAYPGFEGRWKSSEGIEYTDPICKVYVDAPPRS